MVKYPLSVFSFFADTISFCVPFSSANTGKRCSNYEKSRTRLEKQEECDTVNTEKPQEKMNMNNFYNFIEKDIATKKTQIQTLPIKTKTNIKKFTTVKFQYLIRA